MIISPYCMPGSQTIRNAITFSKTLHMSCPTITLAFWNSGGWDSGTPDATLLSDIQNAGGNIIISFGGYTGCKKGREPALKKKKLNDIIALYQQPITMYKINYIDLDIEMGSELDAKTFTLRNTALVSLQKANPSLKLSFTVPADQTGIACQSMLQDAVKQGVKIDRINLMLMDYGVKIDLVSASISGLQNAYKQLSSIGLGSIPLGFIPLLMLDDDGINTYTIDIHNQILSQIKALGMTSYVKNLSYWELAIDEQQKFAFLASYLQFKV